ncbi:T9SS type A sorting domain-containing protein [Ferruginibacter sp. HRS2-29]|uniref:T9SS type A sorting domain-containing protein n=2 Tax=Ferruginibacter sp. HRS2-29 TaxID=2487334 RepID=UPI0020CECF05|nr:T9SS type A sorting domain-containing protein [Ferruginibacter sp. HRS2-29]
MQFTGVGQMIIIGSNCTISMKNNIFWLTDGVDVARSGIFNLAQNTHENNIYHLGTGSVLGFTANASELSTMASLFTSIAGTDPELWNYNPLAASPAVDFGRSVGLTRDFAGTSVAGNSTPNAGMLEGGVTTPTTPLAATSTAAAVACNGGTTTVTVAATGGTAPYTGTGTFTKPAGTHTFTVTDAAGASATTSVTVTQPLLPLTAVLSAGVILLNGGVTAITTVAAGGTIPYTYSLNAGTYQSSNIFNGVAAGTHRITVKDSKGCTVSETITITQPGPAPAPLVAAASATGTIACNGGTTSVTVSATGGTAPYTGTGTFTKGAGTHNFTVTDAAGLTSMATVTITEPTALTSTVTSGTITVNGGSTTITAGASGGTAPYTYKLNNGSYQSSTTFTNVFAGTHTVTAKDANGCTSVKTITITEPAPVPLAAAASATGTIACNGGTTSVTVSATGGTAPYTGTGTFTKGAGTHNFTVTDAAGSTATATVTITQPTVLNSTATAGTITVNGGSTTITAGVSGGTAPYTYKLNNGSYQSSNTFINVIAGTHTVTAKDANGCTSVKTITITEPAPVPTLVVTATASIILCNGGTAVVSVNATGGTAPYTGTGTFTRTAGTYTFTVTDAAGVSASAAATVQQPAALTGTLTAGTIAVNGGTTTLTAIVSGGTPDYSYKLNSGNYVTSGIFTGVTAGTHTVTFRDKNACTITKTITITEPAPVPPLVATASVTGTIACFGGTTTVNVAATGGTAPYTGTGNFTRAAGTYTFTVTDAAGVTDEVTVTVTEPTVLNATVTSGTITVNGGSTTMTVTAAGGTAPYTYKLNNGAYQSSNIFTNVTAGSYTVTVKDANNCTVSKTRTISQPGAPAPLVAAATAGTITCNGGTTSVVVTATGGTGSYTGVGTFTKAAGTYTFVVTDAAGVTDDVTITVTQPTLINVTVATGTIAVYGGSTTATATATGGTPGYTYSYDNGAYQSSNVFTNVVAGTHSIRAKDTKGCITTKTFSVSQPAQVPALVAAATAGTINCYGENTIVTVTAAGGTAPYTGTGTYTKAAGTYTFTVTDALGTTDDVTITVAQPAAITVSVATGTIAAYGGTTTATVTATGGTGAYTYSYDNGTYQASNSFSNVTAGTHNIRVKDAKGCIGVKSFTVTQPAAIPTLVAAATATSISCNGGSATVTVTATGGTAPYTGTGSFTKAAGTYTFTVTDANGAADDVTITIAQPTAISVSVAPGTIAVNGGTTSATVTATGGTAPYTYKLNDGAYQSGNTFSNLVAGTYSVTVKDSKGCTGTKSFTISEPDVITDLGLIVNSGGFGCRGSNTGYIKAEARGGFGPYTYQLDNGTFGTNNVFTRLAAGTYTVTVKDASQRTVSTRAVISESRRRCNAIYLTALGNPSISDFRVKIETDNTNDPITMVVMNMAGQKVYQTNGKANDINTFGREFTQGTYILRVQQGTEVETIRLVKAR